MQEVTNFVLQFLNAVGDLIDLRYALHPQSRPNFQAMSPAEIMRYNNLHGHCSALVKVSYDSRSECWIAGNILTF